MERESLFIVKRVFLDNFQCILKRNLIISQRSFKYCNKHTYYNKHPSYILPVFIDTVVSHPISTASNFRTILWKINVK